MKTDIFFLFLSSTGHKKIMWWKSTPSVDDAITIHSRKNPKLMTQKFFRRPITSSFSQQLVFKESPQRRTFFMTLFDHIKLNDLLSLRFCAAPTKRTFRFFDHKKANFTKEELNYLFNFNLFSINHSARFDYLWFLESL